MTNREELREILGKAPPTTEAEIRRALVRACCEDAVRPQVIDWILWCAMVVAFLALAWFAWE